MNLITITGHLGRDPESKTIPGGKVVVSTSIGVSQGRDKSSFWLDISAWEDGYTLFAANNLASARKGDKIVVSGRLTMREWTDKDGATRQSWGITAQDVEVARKVEAPAATSSQRGHAATEGRRYSSDANRAAPSRTADHFDDEEIPF